MKANNTDIQKMIANATSKADLFKSMLACIDKTQSDVYSDFGYSGVAGLHNALTRGNLFEAKKILSLTHFFADYPELEPALDVLISDTGLSKKNKPIVKDEDDDVFSYLESIILEKEPNNTDQSNHTISECKRSLQPIPSKLLELLIESLEIVPKRAIVLRGLNETYRVGAENLRRNLDLPSDRWVEALELGKSQDGFRLP